MPVTRACRGSCQPALREGIKKCFLPIDADTADTQPEGALLSVLNHKSKFDHRIGIQFGVTPNAIAPEYRFKFTVGELVGITRIRTGE